MHIGKRRRRVASSEVRMARTAPPGKEDSGTALGAGKKTLAPHSPCPGQRRLWHRPRALALGGAPGQRRLWHALAPSRALAGGPSRTARRAKKTLAPPSRGTARRAKKTLAPPSGKEDSGTALSPALAWPSRRVLGRIAPPQSHGRRSEAQSSSDTGAVGSSWNTIGPKAGLERKRAAKVISAGWGAHGCAGQHDHLGVAHAHFRGTWA
jgi:hypothetical protein